MFLLGTAISCNLFLHFSPSRKSYPPRICIPLSSRHSGLSTHHSLSWHSNVISWSLTICSVPAHTDIHKPGDSDITHSIALAVLTNHLCIYLTVVCTTQPEWRCQSQSWLGYWVCHYLPLLVHITLAGPAVLRSIMAIEATQDFAEQAFLCKSQTRPAGTPSHF